MIDLRVLSNLHHVINSTSQFHASQIHHLVYTTLSSIPVDYFAPFIENSDVISEAVDNFFRASVEITETVSGNLLDAGRTPDFLNKAKREELFKEIDLTKKEGNEGLDWQTSRINEFRKLRRWLTDLYDFIEKPINKAVSFINSPVGKVLFTAGYVAMTITLGAPPFMPFWSVYLISALVVVFTAADAAKTYSAAKDSASKKICYEVANELVLHKEAEKVVLKEEDLKLSPEDQLLKKKEVARLKIAHEEANEYSEAAKELFSKKPFTVLKIIAQTLVIMVPSLIVLGFAVAGGGFPLSAAFLVCGISMAISISAYNSFKEAKEEIIIEKRIEGRIKHLEPGQDVEKIFTAQIKEFLDNAINDLKGVKVDEKTTASIAKIIDEIEESLEDSKQKHKLLNQKIDFLVDGLKNRDDIHEPYKSEQIKRINSVKHMLDKSSYEHIYDYLETKHLKAHLERDSSKSGQLAQLKSYVRGVSIIHAADAVKNAEHLNAGVSFPHAARLVHEIISGHKVESSHGI